MAAVTYTAKRSLASGHTEGTEYSLDISLSALERRVDTVKDTATSLSGRDETLLHRLDVRWSCTTTYIDSADMPELREFLASTAGGESFTFDPYGTVASPDDPVTVTRQGNGYRERRIAPALRMYQVAFEVKEV